MRQLRYGVGLVLLSCLFACKVSDDALALAQQMTSTSTELGAYYGAIADTLRDTIALNELNKSLFGVPFEADDRKLIEDARTEVLKRKALAQSLAGLATRMNALTKANVASDVETAAKGLGDEMVKIKELPSGSPVPGAMAKAGNFLMEIVQQHEEKKAARAMNETFAALAELFEKEQPMYDSIARQHLSLAKTLAVTLIRRQAVDPTGLLQPALKPFGLTAFPADKNMQATLRDLAQDRLNAAAEEAARREMDASSAMLSALQEMSSRTRLLAEEKPMPFRHDPISLKTVESWVASVESWTASLI